MLGWRLAISAILIPALFGLFYLDHQTGTAAPLLAAFVALIAARSAWEMGDLYSGRKYAIRRPWLMLASVMIAGAAWWPAWFWPEPVLDTAPFACLGPMTLCLALWLLFFFLREAGDYQTPGKTVEALGFATLTLGYCGVLLGVTAQLRWVAGAPAGYFVLGSVLIAAKSCDIGAYTFGRLFGKSKMAPHLSPGKTWAGAGGGIATATVATWAWLRFVPPMFNTDWGGSPHGYACAYGAIVGLAGMLGDLCESLLKRDAGKKDSAALFPGFGGLLDLVDSVLFAGPVAYLLWVWWPLAGWR